MPFDGAPHDRADLILPYAYHPKAPHTAVCYNTALENAYVAGRWNARSFFSIVYPHNMRSPAGEPDSGAWTAYTLLAEGYRVVPHSYTHAVAEVAFKCTGARDATAYHRIVATDGSTTKTGTAVTTTITHAAMEAARIANYTTPNGVSRPLGSSAPADRFTTFDFYQIVRCEVELGVLNAGAVTVRGYVEGYATLDNTSPVEAATYNPYSVVAWFEMRG